MEANKEVKIAIIVGIIMITICVVIFIIKNQEKVNYNNVELRVFKISENEDTESGRGYRECRVTTDDIINMYKEFQKITNLPQSQKVVGQQISGDYQVAAEDTYIAFDADGTNFVYRGDTNNIYKFNSTLYNYVANLCK